jgi:pimeloyl-ACP methyl ester carboxylesterase
MSDALLTEPDLVSELRATGVPAMVCFGEHDDAWGPGPQRDMARRLGARVEVIADAAHSPAAERPAATAKVLADFWSAPTGS